MFNTIYNKSYWSMSSQDKASLHLPKLFNKVVYNFILEFMGIKCPIFNHMFMTQWMMKTMSIASWSHTTCMHQLTSMRARLKMLIMVMKTICTIYGSHCLKPSYQHLQPCISNKTQECSWMVTLTNLIKSQQHQLFLAIEFEVKAHYKGPLLCVIRV